MLLSDLSGTITCGTAICGSGELCVDGESLGSGGSNNRDEHHSCAIPPHDCSLEACDLDCANRTCTHLQCPTYPFNPLAVRVRGVICRNRARKLER